MAKESTSFSFKNACIDYERMIISEVSKDDCEEFDLQKILKQWDGIDGISFTLKKDNDISPIDENEVEEGDED